MEIEYTVRVEGVDWEQLRADLEADDFHNGRTSEELERSFRNSHAVAFAWSGGRVVGVGRAISDQVCNAYVVDVWTHSTRRRQGIASRLMRLLEGRCPGQHIYLFTDDALDFYERIGYGRQGVGVSKVIGQWLGRLPPRRESP